jgi:hypothetical protein
MPVPSFDIVHVGNNTYTINDQGRTLATLSSQGAIDWLLRNIAQPGELVTEIVKETHLCYVNGFKFLLAFPTPGTLMHKLTYSVEDGGRRAVFTGECTSPDGNFASTTTAELTVDARGDYRWALESSLTVLKTTTMRGIEFNNVYPHHTGCCMLYEPQKMYRDTLMVDADGVIWRFPHQHMLHYYKKISTLTFAEGSVAGFFGDPASENGYPVVKTHRSSLPPDWAICDMYYDLHCMARVQGEVPAGTTYRFAYDIYYLDKPEAQAMLDASRPIPITLDDWEQHDYPRLELGLNNFVSGCDISQFDDSSGFRQRPPQCVWDRETGHRAKGSLRITNATAEETVWSAEPPTQIPGETTLNITAMMKTQDVQGKGLYLRMRYHTFVWHPTPHVEWPVTLTSVPVTGTTDGWVQVTIPALKVPKEQFDYLIWFDVILDGKGVGWVTDVDVDLQYDNLTPPVLEEGGSNRKANFRVQARKRAGAGPGPLRG